MNAEMKINVMPVLLISKSTAEFCLKMVENYCNATGAMLKIFRNDEGTYTYEFVYKEAKIEN